VPAAWLGIVGGLPGQLVADEEAVIQTRPVTAWADRTVGEIANSAAARIRGSIRIRR